MPYFFKLAFLIHFLSAIAYLSFGLFTDYENRYLNYYNRVIIPQGWSMFAPNPTKSYLEMFYSCPGELKEQKLNTSGSLIDKIFNNSIRSFIIHELIKMIYYKELRLKNNNMSNKDFLIYSSTKEKMEKILNKNCSVTGYNIQEFKYRIEIKGFYDL